MADEVSATHPPKLRGLWASEVVHLARQRDRVALDHLLVVETDEGVAGRVCKRDKLNLAPPTEECEKEKNLGKGDGRGVRDP
jgi:hypothetical protein